jgi:hypothetical protein
VAFRLTLVSDTSVDVAMLLRDVMTPLPMRAGWGQDMAWPYPGIPKTLVAELAGYEVADLPFFPIETVTTDHGPVYKNHHLIEAQRVIGANILPARVLRPTDKQAVERAFSGIQSLLLEMLLGWRGIDTADRGEDPEADAVLTVAQAERLIATWVVASFTDRRLFGSAADLGFHVAYMFATAESKDQRGRGRSLAGSAGPPSLVAGERGGHRGSGRLTSPGRSQKAARRTWRTLAGPVGKKIWQNRKFGEYGPCWDPGGDHSPNTLFAAAMAQGGFSLEIPRPELYYELLPAHHVKIHRARGVKILGLWYDGPP